MDMSCTCPTAVESVAHLHHGKGDKDGGRAQDLGEDGRVDVSLANRKLVAHKGRSSRLAHLQVVAREPLPVCPQQVGRLAHPVVRSLAHKALVLLPCLRGTGESLGKIEVYTKSRPLTADGGLTLPAPVGSVRRCRPL